MIAGGEGASAGEEQFISFNKHMITSACCVVFSVIREYTYSELSLELDTQIFLCLPPPYRSKSSDRPFLPGKFAG